MSEKVITALQHNLQEQENQANTEEITEEHPKVKQFLKEQAATY